MTAWSVSTRQDGTENFNKLRTPFQSKGVHALCWCSFANWRVSFPWTRFLICYTYFFWSIASQVNGYSKSCPSVYVLFWIANLLPRDRKRNAIFLIWLKGNKMHNTCALWLHLLTVSPFKDLQLFSNCELLCFYELLICLMGLFLLCNPHHKIVTFSLINSCISSLFNSLFKATLSKSEDINTSSLYHLLIFGLGVREGRVGRKQASGGWQAGGGSGDKA